MELLVATLVLRPYVFGFLVAFAVAAAIDVGWRRTVVFAAWVWPVAWVSEFASTRWGVPFGEYHYTGGTRELYIADVPFMDSVSFVFLAYAALCVARVALGPRRATAPRVAVLGGALMMALDVVIDPAAVRGDRWFLGRIFYYPDGGLYFGVPLSNFLGWFVVGVVGIGGYLVLAGARTGATGVWGREPRGGVALYYAVVLFNLAVTAWIREWALVIAGVALHAAIATWLRRASQTTEPDVEFGDRRIESA